MVLIDSRPAGEAAGPLPASVATPERMLTPRMPLLFLVADTGGGHRSAARAVGEAVEEAYPGRFDAVLCDPLGGPGSSRLLRWITGLYGPVIRFAPWAWGAVYHACDSPCAMRLLQRTLLSLADRAMTKLGARDRAQLVVFAYQAGLVRPGWS